MCFSSSQFNRGELRLRTWIKVVYVEECHRFLYITAVGVNQANCKHWNVWVLYPCKLRKLNKNLCLVWLTLVNLVSTKTFRLTLQTLSDVVLLFLSKKKNAQRGIPSSVWGTERCALRHWVLISQIVPYSHHTCCLENYIPLKKLMLTSFFFPRLMLPLLLLLVLLMIASWSIILLMTHLTLLCLMGKFQTVNGINLHQKRFLGIMKSCKFHQCSV